MRRALGPTIKEAARTNQRATIPIAIDAAASGLARGRWAVFAVCCLVRPGRAAESFFGMVSIVLRYTLYTSLIEKITDLGRTFDSPLRRMDTCQTWDEAPLESVPDNKSPCPVHTVISIAMQSNVIQLGTRAVSSCTHFSPLRTDNNKKS